MDARKFLLLPLDELYSLVDTKSTRNGFTVTMDANWLGAVEAVVKSVTIELFMSELTSTVGAGDGLVVIKLSSVRTPDAPVDGWLEIATEGLYEGIGDGLRVGPRVGEALKPVEIGSSCPTSISAGVCFNTTETGSSFLNRREGTSLRLCCVPFSVEAAVLVSSCSCNSSRREDFMIIVLWANVKTGRQATHK